MVYFHARIFECHTLMLITSIIVISARNADVDSQNESSISDEIVTKPEQDWRQVALVSHNKLRIKHGLSFLQQDKKLDQIAQKHADYLAANDLFDHSTGNEYGENLMLTSENSEADAIRDAVDSWYEEIKDYDFEDPGYSKETSHFTTMMWKTTTHMGVGMAFNKKKKQFVVVANYNPGGNVDGEYNDNVFPLKTLEIN